MLLRCFFYNIFKQIEEELIIHNATEGLQLCIARAILQIAFISSETARRVATIRTNHKNGK